MRQQDRDEGDIEFVPESLPTGRERNGASRAFRDVWGKNLGSGKSSGGNEMTVPGRDNYSEGSGPIAFLKRRKHNLQIRRERKWL